MVNSLPSSNFCTRLTLSPSTVMVVLHWKETLKNLYYLRIHRETGERRWNISKMRRLLKTIACRWWRETHYEHWKDLSEAQSRSRTIWWLLIFKSGTRRCGDTWGRPMSTGRISAEMMIPPWFFVTSKFLRSHWSHHYEQILLSNGTNSAISCSLHFGEH